MPDPMVEPRAAEGPILRRIREPFPGVTVVDCGDFALALDDWKDGVTCTVYDTPRPGEAPDLGAVLGIDVRGAFTISGRPVPGPQPESVARLSPLLWSVAAAPGRAELVLYNGGTILIGREHVIGLQPGVAPEIIHTRAGLSCHGWLERRRQ